MPNVVLEAMASARPVLGTQVAGTADLIAEGYGGWLVPRGDPQALAEKLEQLVRMRAHLVQNGLAGRQIVEAKYSLKCVASMYVNEYQAMLSERLLQA
jgi:glycosyltransferase involved in cell wall biosynthesis